MRRRLCPLLQELEDRDHRYVVDDLALRACVVQQDHTARALITAALQRIPGTAASWASGAAASGEGGGEGPARADCLDA